MKKFLIAATLLFSGLAIAESQVEVRVNRIDMAVTAPDDTDEVVEKEVTEEAVESIESVESRTSTKSADYNSSRSNRTGIIDPDDDDDGLETKRCGNDKDDDCDGPRAVSPANHNSTRSK